MIIEYEKKYDECVKNLLVELQEHIAIMDKEGYNILTREYKEEYFKKTLEEVNKYEGKILLYKEQDKILGLVIGLINNDKSDTYEFSAPKRGRITELIVSKNARSNGIGAKLLEAMENYLYSVDCKDIMLCVLAYNTGAYEFYKKHGYHARVIDMTK